MIKQLVDMHCHTSFSPDAEDSLTQMLERACLLNLAALSVTDHCDCNMWYPVSHYFDDVSKAADPIMYSAGEYSLASIAAQCEISDKYRDRLNFCVGIELGQPLQNLEKAEQIAADDRLDFIIGSHHQNRGEEDFYFLQYDKMLLSEIYRLLEDCFEQTLQMCRWGRFDVLGHLTYPLRYICGKRYSIDIDLSRFDEVIREIFKTLISNGKGIEINTSGLRQDYKKTFPTYEYVRLFRQLGGEIITVGSDAHRAADLGSNIAEGIEIARAAGFERIACFKKHQPIFINI